MFGTIQFSLFNHILNELRIISEKPYYNILDKQKNVNRKIMIKYKHLVHNDLKVVLLVGLSESKDFQIDYNIEKHKYAYQFLKKRAIDT